MLAFNQGVRAEVKVARVPLATSPRDPQGIGGLAVIDFFSAEPRVTAPQVVDFLSKGFASQPAIFQYNPVGQPSTSLRNATKYLRYDFESSRCEGAQVQGLNSKICQRSDNGQVLDTPLRRHAIVSLLAEEPTGDGEEVADGLLIGPRGAEILWVLDISAPVDAWSQLNEQVDYLISSFAVGSEAQLAAARGA